MSFIPYSDRKCGRRRCSQGQNVNVSNNVKIGNGCKLQNNVFVYEGVEMEDYVFCGSLMVFTDLTPRVEYPKGGAGYKKTLLKTGTTVGQCDGSLWQYLGEVVDDRFRCGSD